MRNSAVSQILRPTKTDAGGGPETGMQVGMALHSDSLQSMTMIFDLYQLFLHVVYDILCVIVFYICIKYIMSLYCGRAS